MNYYPVAELEPCEVLAKRRAVEAGEKWDQLSRAEREYQLTQAGQWLSAAVGAGYVQAGAPR
jgi:hypothetical protein